MYCDIRNEEKRNNNYWNASSKAVEFCSSFCARVTTQTPKFHSASKRDTDHQAMAEVPLTLLRLDEPVIRFWKHYFKVKNVA